MSDTKMIIALSRERILDLLFLIHNEMKSVERSQYVSDEGKQLLLGKWEVIHAAMAKQYWRQIRKPVAPAVPAADRAVVATIEDRRWVAALAPVPEDDGAFWWHYYEWSEEDATLVQGDQFDQDNGQDAADMVAAYMARMLPYRMTDDEAEDGG